MHCVFSENCEFLLHIHRCQYIPEPMNPCLQRQENEPIELEHSAFSEQLCISSSHSSMSVHSNPVPMNPDLQKQEKEPIELEHCAFSEQLCIPSIHSSMSVHSNPEPVNPYL